MDIEKHIGRMTDREAHVDTNREADNEIVRKTTGRLAGRLTG